MGLSFGGSSQTSQQQNQGQQSQTGNASGTTSGSQANTYSGGQSDLQTMLGQLFQSLIPSFSSGTATPLQTAATTGAADQINKSYQGSGDALTKQLAARGLGSSGQSGQATLQTELGRQSALANNLTSSASSSIDQQNQDLLAALNYAFTSTGLSTAGSTFGTGTTNTSGSSSGTSSGSGSNWGANVSGAIGIP
ncbi:MAG TPA: hypothetical protein VG273_16575 [Bryobacteraceae bacterium]|jgi:hypothetical protein|nr:hypothetical protein [Bryobacteraceae bacterium]